MSHPSTRMDAVPADTTYGGRSRHGIDMVYNRHVRYRVIAKNEDEGVYDGPHPDDALQEFAKDNGHSDFNSYMRENDLSIDEVVLVVE